MSVDNIGFTRRDHLTRDHQNTFEFYAGLYARNSCRFYTIIAGNYAYEPIINVDKTTMYKIVHKR